MKIGKKLDRRLAQIQASLDRKSESQLEMQLLAVILLGLLQKQIPNFESDIMQAVERRIATFGNPAFSQLMMRYENDTPESVELGRTDSLKAAHSLYDWLTMIFNDKADKPTKPHLD